jgi:hypothetical protein
MEIGNIVKGHVNELLNLNGDISAGRIEICKKCPLFKNILGGQCNPRLYLNPETGEISNKLKDGFYRGCGCRL